MIIFVYWHCVSLNSSARSRSSLKLKLSLPPRPLFSCIFSIYLPKSWRRSLGISACFAASLTCFLSILFAPFLVSLVFESFLINFFIICLIIGFSPVGSTRLSEFCSAYTKTFNPPANPIGSGEMYRPVSGSE